MRNVRTEKWAWRASALGVVMALTGSAGCASREAAYQVTADEVQDLSGMDAVRTKADGHWANRESEEELRAAIASYLEVVAKNPRDRDALVLLSRGHYLLAYGHLDGDERQDERLEAYNAGASWGEKALALNPKFLAAYEQSGKDYEALSECTADDVPAIFWVYANTGRWANEKGFTTILKYKSKLKAFADRVAELDAAYYYGGGHRLLGTYYAKAPSFAGGDLDKSWDHFQQALAIAPDYFNTKVLAAEFYATKRQDRALFEKLLGEVIDGDPAVLPEVLAEQKIEQRKARELLARVDDLFA